MRKVIVDDQVWTKLVKKIDEIWDSHELARNSRENIGCAGYFTDIESTDDEDGERSEHYYVSMVEMSW